MFELEWGILDGIVLQLSTYQITGDIECSIRLHLLSQTLRWDSPLVQKSVVLETKLYKKRLCNSLLFPLSYTTSCPQEIFKGTHVTRPVRKRAFILLPSLQLTYETRSHFSRSRNEGLLTVRRVVTVHSKDGMKFISWMSDIIQCLSLFNERSPKQ
jgi:hypothetical protein